MHIKNLKIYLVFICIISIQIAKSNPITNSTSYANQKDATEKLLQIWRKVNTPNPKQRDPYPIQVWEHLLLNAYNNAAKANDSDLLFRVSLPLGVTYHSETKFSKGLPIFQYLLKHKKDLSKYELQKVLIKLEEEYRGFNDIEHALAIRKERISNHFINSYWEIYRDCGLYEAAKKDLQAFVQLPPLYSQARLFHYFLLGDLFFQMKQFDSATKVYTLGLNQARETRNINFSTKFYKDEDIVYWEGCFMGNIIKCNIQNGNFINAIPTLLFDINHSNENTDNKVIKMILLSESYIHFKQFTNARKYLDSSSLLMEGKIAKTMQNEYLLTESNYYKAINKNDSALYYFKLYNDRRDELFQNIQKNQSIILLGQMEISNRRDELLASKQSLYDSLKKNESQNTALLILIFSLASSIMLGVFLYRNNLNKSKSNLKIEAQNKMINEHAIKIEAQFNHNETLLKELHHRVKNNLQVMYSLLNLQKRRNEDKDTIDTLSSIQNRIQTMALVHQNLYSSDNFEFVEITSYIRTLANHLEDIYKFDHQKIELVIETLDNLQLPIEIVVAIGLIINEAVSNSFKYAFKNKVQGQILIKLYKIKEEITIVIQDNGNGIVNEIKKENSLGLKLIDLMCAQLNATHIVENTKGIKHQIKFNR